MGDFLQGLGTAKAPPIKLEGVGGVLQQFADKLIVALRKSLDGKTKYDSLLGQSLKPKKIQIETTAFGDTLTFELDLPYYWKWVDGGRLPTKSTTAGNPPLREKLRGTQGWVARKPIKLPLTYSYKRKLKDGKEKTYTYKYKNSIAAAKAVAFMIARKIHRFGYKGNNFYTEVVTDSLLNDLRKELSAAAKKDIIVSITQT